MTATSNLVLLDANALFALGWPNHEFHEAIVGRLDPPEVRWATCSITQLAFIRLSCNEAVTGVRTSPWEAVDLLESLVGDSRHVYLSRMPGPVDVLMKPYFKPLTGFRQTTDAYLTALADSADAALLTFDRRLHGMSPKQVELLGASA